VTHTRSVFWLAAAVGVLFSWTPLVAQEPAGSLRLEDVLADLRERNPRTLAEKAMAEAMASQEPESSTLPDPTLQLGVLNFGVPRFNADMAMSMAPSIQLKQMVPFPGKLSLRGKIASYQTEIARAEAEEVWWKVRERAASFFYELYALDRRVTVMRETQALLVDFQQVAKAMYSAGSGRQTDVLRADVEVARVDGDIRQLEALRIATAARLNGLLARASDAHLASPDLGSQPLDVAGVDELRQLAAAHRPLLLMARLSTSQASSQTELAVKEIRPDLTFGLSYGQRDRGTGTERMASATVGFSLPIHAGSRQYALRDAATARERVADANLSGLEADVDAQIGTLLAELTRARTLAQLYREEILPEARATVESAFSSYRVGTVDFLTLVDAQMTVNRFAGDLYVLQGDYGRAIAALESAIGQALPRSGPTLLEVR